MTDINQYYLDVITDNGILLTSNLFDPKVYSEKFDINDLNKYKNSEYYSWINESFKRY